LGNTGSGSGGKVTGGWIGFQRSYSFEHLELDGVDVLTNTYRNGSLRSTVGDVIGLFLREAIPAGLSPAETLAEIRRQGGVSYLPHPFGRRGLSRTMVEAFTAPDVLERLDIVEAFNSRNFTGEANRLARAFADTHRLPIGAGSDAHTPFEIGNAFVITDEFDGPKSFLASLQGAEIVGRRTPMVLRAVLNHIVRRRLRAWRRRSAPGDEG
jgi:predicted metal-dependent phosphoesterase TrpH